MVSRDFSLSLSGWILIVLCLASSTACAISSSSFCIISDSTLETILSMSSPSSTLIILKFAIGVTYGSY